MSTDLGAALSGCADETGFCGAVRVADADGHVVVDFARGLADRETSRRNTTGTRFATASGTKLFTALAVGTLIDDGRVALETPLSDVLETPTPNAAAVTIGHLLGHTSGVYDYYDEELIDDFDNFALPIAPASLSRLEDYRPMLFAGPKKFEPGARFAYSNGGYILLGLVVEALTGAAFADVVSERVFAAATMRDSGFFRFDALPADAARGYVETADGFHRNEALLPIIGGADGGAFATTGDMQRLWEALFGGQILSADLTRAFATRRREYKPNVHYGFGLWLGDTPPRAYVEGSDAGVSFQSTRYDNRMIATVVSNSSEGAWPLANAIDEAVAATITARPGSGS